MNGNGKMLSMDMVAHPVHSFMSRPRYLEMHAGAPHPGTYLLGQLGGDLISCFGGVLVGLGQLLTMLCDARVVADTLVWRFGLVLRRKAAMQLRLLAQLIRFRLVLGCRFLRCACGVSPNDQPSERSSAMSLPAETAASPGLTAAEVLDDAAASKWLKNALREALHRDPVDALNDALVLAAVLESHLREMLELDS